LHVFLNSTLVAGEWSASRPVRLASGGRVPGTSWCGTVCEREQSLAPVGNGLVDPRSPTPWLSLYSDWAVPAPDSLLDTQCKFGARLRLSNFSGITSGNSPVQQTFCWFFVTLRLTLEILDSASNELSSFLKARNLLTDGIVINVSRNVCTLGVIALHLTSDLLQNETVKIVKPLDRVRFSFLTYFRCQRIAVFAAASRRIVGLIHLRIH